MNHSGFLRKKTILARCLIAGACWFAAVSAVAAENINNVRDFGAVGDGQTLDTSAIQKAIDACSLGGGGMVFFPPGTYLSGTICLKSNVHIKMERGAELLGTKDLDQYLKPSSPDHYVYATGSKHIFLYGENVENVKIEGQGVIDGNWAAYIDPVTKQEKRGPMAILFVHSKNITLNIITVTRSPGWAVTFFDCQSVNILGVKIINCKCDGINPVCCQDVLYDGVIIDGTGDDPITIKNEGKLDKPHCTRNITVRNTTVRNTSNPGVKIGTGTAGTFENITVENSTFDIDGDFFAIQLMRPAMPQNPDRFINNVILKNITVKNAARFLDITTIGVSTPVIRNLRFEDIRFTGKAVDSRILGLAKAPIDNVVIKNVAINARQAGPLFLKTQYLSNLCIENLELNGEKIDTFLLAEYGCGLTADQLTATSLTSAAPAVRLNDFQNADLADLNFSNADNLIFVSGEASKNINLLSWRNPNAKHPMLADTDVPADALTPRADKATTEHMTLPGVVPAGQPFTAAVNLRNTESPGAYKVQVFLADQCVAQQWVWLNATDEQTVTLPCAAVYQPGEYQAHSSACSQKIIIEKTPADIRYGRFCQVEIPASPNTPAIFIVPVANLGGEPGDKNVELKADGQIVASKSIILQPGEHATVRLEYTIPDNQPHHWQVGDFPEWPWVTFRNTGGKFFLGRDEIKIEAAGRSGSLADLGAVYWHNIEGDFDVTVKCLSQTETTGSNAAIGMVIRNNIADNQSGGFTIHYRAPRYGGYKVWQLDRDGDGKFETRFDGGRIEFPLWLKFEKRGQTFNALTSADGQNWSSCGIPIAMPSAAAVQDVGIYANAWSDSGEFAVAEFAQLTLRRVAP